MSRKQEDKGRIMSVAQELSSWQVPTGFSKTLKWPDIHTSFILAEAGGALRFHLPHPQAARSAQGAG